MRTATPTPFDGPGVLRPLDPLARAIEAASTRDVMLAIVAVSRIAREEAEQPRRLAELDALARAAREVA